jgi:ABC-type Fe3+-hydroxamate transport system substrate-binding protein
MPEFTNQMGRVIALSAIPRRIISLVPSQTELLYQLGLDEEVVGITLFCIHPESWHKSKTRIGGTKKLKLDLIRRLKPDLIIGNKEENTEEQITELMHEFPVWMSDIKTLDEALDMILRVGNGGKEEQAKELTTSIKAAFNEIPRLEARSVLYYIWQKPDMVAGKTTFIGDMLTRCGLKNLAETWEGRYPEVPPTSPSPDFIFIIRTISFQGKTQGALSTAVPKSAHCIG